MGHLVVVVLLLFLPQDCRVLWRRTSQQNLFPLKASVFTPLRLHNWHVSRPLGNRSRQRHFYASRSYTQNVLTLPESAFMSMCVFTSGCLNGPLCCLPYLCECRSLCVSVCILGYVYTRELLCMCLFLCITVCLSMKLYVYLFLCACFSGYVSRVYVMNVCGYVSAPVFFFMKF